MGSDRLQYVSDRPSAPLWHTFGVNMICGEHIPGARFETNGKGWRITFENVVMAEGPDHDEVVRAGRQAIRTIAQRRADPQLADLTDAGLTSFLPAVLTARRCSASHLQLLDEGVVTANWWPSTGKARAEGPGGGVAAPTQIKTVPELVAWLKAL